MQDVLEDRFQDPVLTPAAFIDARLAAFVDTLPIKVLQAGLAPDSLSLAAAETALDTAVTALEAAVTPSQAALAAAQVATATTQVNAARAQFALDQQALIRSIADAVSVHLYEAGKQELLEAEAMKAFKLSEDLAPIVLRLARLKQPVAAGNRTLLDLLTDDVLVDTVTTPPAPPAITPAAFDDQYRALRLLHLMAAFLATLKLPADTVAWMLTNNPTLGWLELDDLTYQAGVTPVTFDAWERLQDTLRFIAAYPPVEDASDPAKPFSATGLFELPFAAGVTLAQIEEYLARLAGWDATVLADLNARFGHTVADFERPDTYTRLDAAMVLLRTLGLSVTAAVGVIKPTLTPADAAVMRGALKARYEESEWLAALQGVQDPLREQKRDALVAYLLAVNPGDEVVQRPVRLLPDRRRDGRVHADVAHRAGARHHPAVRAALPDGAGAESVANIKHDSGWDQWKWMKNYRVWEANRKIFLYPENWIEPELRDDKSELFPRLENTLQQNELTDRAVEDAFDRVPREARRHRPPRRDGVLLRDRASGPCTSSPAPRAAIPRSTTIASSRRSATGRRGRRSTSTSRAITCWRSTATAGCTLAWPIFTSEAEEATTPVPNPATDIPAGGKSTREAAEALEDPACRQRAMPARSGCRRRSRRTVCTVPRQRATSITIHPRRHLQLLRVESRCGRTGDLLFQHRGRRLGRIVCADRLQGVPRAESGRLHRRGLPPQVQGHADARAPLRGGQFGRDRRSVDLHPLQPGTYDPITARTPGNFKVTYPMQMSVIDWFFLFFQLYLASQAPRSFLKDRFRFNIPLGTFMPYFYGDFSRTYVIIPGFYQRKQDPAAPHIEKMFSDIIQLVEDALALFFKYLFKLQQDPAHDLNALLTELSVDPKFLALKAEWEVYQTLQFGLKFRNFYHPLVCLLRSTLNREGFPALMQRDIQLSDTMFDFATVYGPSGLVAQPYPREDVDFDLDGAYAGYNWELFFHVPFEIAVRLSQDGRYEEARTWFHYIFNPVGATDAPAPQKYWITKPFFKTTVADYLEQRIDTIMNTIAADPSGATITDLKFAVSEWRDKPFQPHVVARSRPVAYQVSLVLKYIQNLLDWGDNLFRQFTRESVTQATQMYILAEKLLGPKPRIVPMHVAPPDDDLQPARIATGSVQQRADRPGER